MCKACDFLKALGMINPGLHQDDKEDTTEEEPKKIDPAQAFKEFMEKGINKAMKDQENPIEGIDPSELGKLAQRYLNEALDCVSIVRRMTDRVDGPEDIMKGAKEELEMVERFLKSLKNPAMASFVEAFGRTIAKEMYGKYAFEVKLEYSPDVMNTSFTMGKQ